MNNEEDTMYGHLNQAVAAERLVDDLLRSQQDHAAGGQRSAKSGRRTTRVRWLGGERVHASRRTARA